MKRKGMAMVLCFVLLAAMLPVQVQAEERAQTARASDFIDDYNINFYSVGGGKVRIAFEVYATSVMDDVGATRILLYGGPSADQLLPVETFYESTSPNMIASNTSSHSSSVTFTGQSGYYYQALVYVRATKDGVWDSRNTWTSIIRA